jgi:hypothetical protein
LPLPGWSLMAAVWWTWGDMKGLDALLQAFFCYPWCFFAELV